jgi:hypothetical protein
MKFRLYGDSWCYHWLQPDIQLKSKALTSLVNNNVDALTDNLNIFKNPKTTCTNLYSILFKGLGHEMSNAGVPGSQFQKVVDDHIVRMDLDPVDFNIVFVSSMWREADDLNKLPVEAIASERQFNEYMSHTQETIIQRLREYAEKTKQHFFLIGGHQPLHNDADKNTGEYVHVLYFDLLWEEHHNYMHELHAKKVSPAWFRFSTDIDWKEVNLESWGGDVVSKIDNDMREATHRFIDHYNNNTDEWSDPDQPPELKYLLWPDKGHPSPTVMFNVTNEILRLAEKLSEKHRLDLI